MAGRETGYYWVRQWSGDEASIAYWDVGDWWMVGNEVGVSDDSIPEVLEGPITPPKGYTVGGR